MKVICAGLWKTGTKSLAESLRILGYKVFDYDDQLFELGELWDKFHNGTVTDEEIHSSLKDIDVLVDGPVVAFWEEIHKVFPDAKIILTIRDEDSWYKSYQKMHEIISLKVWLKFVLAMLLPSGYHFTRRLATLARFCFGIEGPFSLKPSNNPRLYKLKYRKHNSYVMHKSPEEKLLVHHLADGWDSLCEFLGHSIPDVPYPFLNKSGTLPIHVGRRNQHFETLMRQAEILWYIFMVLLAIAAYWIVTGVTSALF